MLTFRVDHPPFAEFMRRRDDSELLELVHPTKGETYKWYRTLTGIYRVPTKTIQESAMIELEKRNSA